MPDLYFLTASNGQALTKTFSRPRKKDPIQKSNYPHVRNFDSHRESYRTLKEFHDLIQDYAARGACLIKGELQTELRDQSRAGSTNPSTPTSWLCLDFDGVRGVANAEEALALVGIEGVNYVVQYSASAGILRTDTFDAHIFLLLEDDVSPDTIKTWLKHVNLTNPRFADQIQLTRSYNALKWPLDISVNQNDKLIFIAPPEVYDGVQDPLQGKRVQLVRKPKRRDVLAPELFQVDEPMKVETALRRKLNELRKAMGLPAKRNLGEKTYKGVLVGKSPTAALVTGVKEERGYVYLNLNGGDSWGYFFPLKNPEILYNFKGEPNYALKDIAPDLYKDYFARAAELRRDEQQKRLENLANVDEGEVYLAFLDRHSDTYFRGSYDIARNQLILEKTNSLTKVQHFLKQHGEPVGDWIPEWDYLFDFGNPTVFDPKAHFCNRYSPSPYLLDVPEADERGDLDDAPTIRRLITHVLADDGEILEHFLNWLAFILQRRTPARCAWVLHGIQGTGKGVLFNHVIAPLVGHRYVHTKRLTDLEDDFNGFMQECVFLLVDEVQMTDAYHADRVMAKLKNYIVEPEIPIRAMRTDHYMAKNWMNFIFASNKPNPIQIDPTDRRFNVANYQKEPIQITHDDIDAIENELASFAKYILTRPVDEQHARQPLHTLAKERIQYLTRNSIDLFADALRDGNLRYFFDALPAPTTGPIDLDVSANMRQTYFVEMVRKFFASFDKKSKRGEMNISRDDLMRMAEYMLGKVPTSPHKFSAFVKHHGIEIQPVKINGRTIQGVKVKWQIDKDILTEWRKHWQPSSAEISSPTATVTPISSKK